MMACSRACRELQWRAQMGHPDDALDMYLQGSLYRMQIAGPPTAFSFSTVKGTEAVAAPERGEGPPTECICDEWNGGGLHVRCREDLVNTAVLRDSILLKTTEQLE